MARRRSPRARRLQHDADQGPAIPLTDSTSPEATEDELVALMTSEAGLQRLEEESRILTEAARQERAALGLKNFWFFLTQILFPKVWRDHYTEDFHRPLCEALQNLKTGEDLWLFLQREARKSFILTIAHTIWLIVRDPDIRILIVGAREETVKPFTRVIISAFLPGTPGFERFQETYPDFVIHEKGRNIIQTFQFTHPMRKKVLPDPTVRSAYVGVTGAGWRCDVLKYDDCVEARNVTTPEQAAKVLRQMLMLVPLIDKTSKYRNILGAGTRYSYLDPYGRILGEATEEEALLETPVKTSENTKVFVRHIMEEPGTLCDVCPPHVVKRFPHGQPSLDERAEPTMAPLTTREEVFRTLERFLTDPKLGEAMFWHQYMNVCLAPGDQKIKEKWILRAHFPVWPAAKRRVLVLDDASKDFQLAGVGDYCIAIFGEFEENGRLLVVDGLRSNRWTKDEFIRQIVVWCKRHGWWPHIAVKEKVSVDAFLSDLRRAFDEQARPVHVKPTPISPIGGKKFDRIASALQGPMERAELVFGSSCSLEFFARAKYELTNLSQVANDDIADGLALFYADGVRVINPAGHNDARNFEWRGPDMSNMRVFDPTNRTPDHRPERGPWDTAASSDRVQRALTDFNLDEGYDPFEPPKDALIFQHPPMGWDDIE